MTRLSSRSRALRLLAARGLAVMVLMSGAPGAGAEVGAQTSAELISAGDRESLARKPASALPLYEQALALEPRNYDALCKASRELVDLGEYEPDAAKRSAFYARAVEYARRAASITPNAAEAHFHLARAVGRTALALGPRERTKYGVEVREHAMRALQFAPNHPGALHVMGVWHAEIMRLNGISRMVAKTFLGGKVFGSANWKDAARYLEQSVEAEPMRLVHRLDLARIYRDSGRTDETRAAFRTALTLALTDANDDRYRAEAERELRALK